MISHRPLPAPSCSEGANGPRLQPSREGNLSPPFRRALTRGGWRGPHNPAQEDLGTVHGSPWPGGREPWELLGHVGTSGVPTPPAPCPQSEPGSALGMVAPPARSVLGLAKGLDGERRGKQPQQPTSACAVMPGQDHAAVGCPLCWWDAPAVLGGGGRPAGADGSCRPQRRQVVTGGLSGRISSPQGCGAASRTGGTPQRNLSPWPCSPCTWGPPWSAGGGGTAQPRRMASPPLPPMPKSPSTLSCCPTARPHCLLLGLIPRFLLPLGVGDGWDGGGS